MDSFCLMVDSYSRIRRIRAGQVAGVQWLDIRTMGNRLVLASFFLILAGNLVVICRGIAGSGGFHESGPSSTNPSTSCTGREDRNGSDPQFVRGPPPRAGLDVERLGRAGTRHARAPGASTVMRPAVASNAPGHQRE